MEEGYGMIVTGFSNPTPWDSPREITEHELGERLQDMYLRAAGPERLICVAHPPHAGPSSIRLPNWTRISVYEQLEALR
jgi:Icc-related predicted phosphoesterase